MGAPIHNRNISIVLAVAAVVPNVGVTSLAWTASGVSQANGPTETAEADAVDIFLQNVSGRGVHLKVPRAHFRRPLQEGGVTDSVYMYADFLEMRPAIERTQTFDDALDRLQKGDVHTADEPNAERLDYCGSVETTATWWK